jgi:hypothetical protein
VEKNEYNPSDQDMLDAWFIYETISEHDKDLKSENDTDMLKDFDMRLRLVSSQSGFENSEGLEIIKKFYKSWEKKSLMVPDIKKKLKNNEMDQISAYAIAVVQTVVATMPQNDKEKEIFKIKRELYSNKFAERKKNMKTDHYYVQVFLTPEGEIYIDHSIKNEENKIIFKRVSANQFYGDDDHLDRNIKIGVEKVAFYLQKNGLEIESMPVDMIPREREVSKSLSLHEIFYFPMVKKTSMQNNDNFGLLSLEDLLADKDIEESEKEMVVSFFNGEGTVV